jgi:hypothetical protein
MILTLAAISAAGVLFLIFKFGNIRRVLAFDKWIDLAATIGLGVAFFGTLGGMAIAVIAGAIISAILWLMKLAIGHEELTVKGWRQGRPGFLNGGQKWQHHSSYWRWRSHSHQ